VAVSIILGLVDFHISTAISASFFAALFVLQFPYICATEPCMAKLVRPANREHSRRSSFRQSKFKEVLVMAEREGLLAGGRTQVVRGRMPEALVSQAKKRTGIKSDTDLIEIALANIAVGDDYADWLLSQRGTIDPEVDLEF
jgi:hypothetical protein